MPKMNTHGQKMKEELCVMCGKTHFRINDVYNVTLTVDSEVISVI